MTSPNSISDDANAVIARAKGLYAGVTLLNQIEQYERYGFMCKLLSWTFALDKTEQFARPFT